MSNARAAESAPPEPLDGDVLQAAADAAEADSSGMQLPEGIDGAAMASATAELANQRAQQASNSEHFSHLLPSTLMLLCRRICG